MIYKILKEFKNSDNPAYRKVYLDSIKRIIEQGEQLDKILPSEETKNSIKKLRESIKDCTLYPLIEKYDRQ